MTWFIDRRLNGKNKSAVNRQRFLRRYKAQIKQSISEAINKRSVTDIESGESVSIPTDDINEPMFHQGRGGLRNRVHPGNDHFVQNDRIERPQGGGGGGGGARRGAGETKLELDRRHVHARIDALAEKLAEMEKRRGESRKARAKTGMPVVSLVGYTNVGKSSLMNALCGPSVAEADMLFATLDPTSRKLVLPSGMAVLLVDTVGFVSRLDRKSVV